ncbi:MAG: hypothetical protein PVJ40_04380, partial [Gammaproteobacteria bacterium]
EDEVLADIEYFATRLSSLDTSDNSYDQARRHVYEILLAHRRQLLKALRDGRPEAWPEYDAEPAPQTR